MFRQTHIVCQKVQSYKTSNLLYKKRCGTVEVWSTVISHTIHPKTERVNILYKRQKKTRFSLFYSKKRRRTWMILVDPKFEIFLIPNQIKKGRFDQVIHSESRLHFTVHSERQKDLETGRRNTLSSNFCIVKFIYVIISSLLIYFVFKIHFW